MLIYPQFYLFLGGSMKRGAVLALLLVVLSSVAYAGTLIASDTPEGLFFAVGNHHFKDGDFEKASAFFEMAIGQNNEYAAAYHNLAVSYYKLENFKGAVENFKSAIELDSLYSSAYYNLGLLHFETGNFEEAIANLEQAAGLEGTQQHHFDLAQAYVAQFRQKEDSGYLVTEDLGLLRNAVLHLELSPSVEHSSSNLEIARQVLFDYESQ
jgi:tetratricopeptide (TPR) repeat protein